ncbi:MAG TPA: hypothetical protein VGI64_00110 [Streptosporangiaceae bacterium]
MIEASLEQNMAAARHEHKVPGREIHLQNVRGHGFCEVGLVSGTSQDNAIANIWNTTGVCEPGLEQFDELDADAIARENGALRAWLNPVRYWMCDRLDFWEAGDDRAFGAIAGTWLGVIEAATLVEDTAQACFNPAYIYRHDTYTCTFNRGAKVYLLDAPDGEMFILQSFKASRDAPPGELAHFQRRLDLPDGWGYRAEVLDEDVEVSSSTDNLAHVLRDNLDNVYQGSDVGRAFSRLWPANPPG